MDTPVERATVKLFGGLTWVFLGIGIFFVIGCATSSHSTERIINVEGLNLVDKEGKVRATLGIAPKGQVVFHIYDQNKKPKIMLGLTENGEALLSLESANGSSINHGVRDDLFFIIGKDKNEINRLYLTGKDEVVSLKLRDKTGKDGAIIGTAHTKEGMGTILSLRGEKANEIKLGTMDEGMLLFDMVDEEGKSRITLALNKNSPIFTFSDKNESPKILIGVDSKGQSYADLGDKSDMHIASSAHEELEKKDILVSDELGKDNTKGGDLTSESGQEDFLVVKFSGEGSTATRPFSVEKEWEIQWESSGSSFTLTLNPAQGQVTPNLKGSSEDVLGQVLQMIGTVPKVITANFGKPSKGSHFAPKGGSFYLDVSANGPWEVRIVQVGKKK